MRGASFEDRLRRMSAQDAAGTPAAGPRRALDRYDAGLDLARHSGLRPARSLLLRELARLGVPVAPLCYWSAPGLFLWALVLMGAAFGGALWLTHRMFTALDVDGINPQMQAAFMVAYAAVLAVSAALAAVFALWQRWRARRAGLPPWAQI